MGRHVEGPFFRTAKNTWYCTHQGRKVSLRVSGRNNKKAAIAAWHQLLKEGLPEKRERVTVQDAVAQFLGAMTGRLKPSTHALYDRHLKKLTTKMGRMLVTDLTTDNLTKWLRALYSNGTTQKTVLSSVGSFLGWCAKQETIDRNPVLSMFRPKAKSRGAEAVITPEEHARLLEAATPQLRLVLTLLHLTGARPGEVCKITAENFDPNTGIVTLTEHKTDHTGHDRNIYLPPEGVELLKGQVAKYESGPLLRHRQKRAWSTKAINEQVRKIRKRLGLRSKVTPYGYRHTLCTDALAAGLPEAHVSSLMGHASTQMIFKHYSHLTSKSRLLSKAITMVR